LYSDHGFLYAKIDEMNALQSLHLIGKMNKSLSFYKGPNNIQKLLGAFKNNLEAINHILDQSNLTFTQLVQHNTLLERILKNILNIFYFS
jgi:hypothetical protein